MKMLPLARRLGAAVVFLVGVTAACSDPVAPRTVSVGAAVGEDSYGAFLTVCKVGPLGTDATFSISADGGQFLLGSTVTIAAKYPDPDYSCVEVWRAPNTTAPVSVSITEIAATAGTALNEIIWVSELDGWGEGDVASKTATVRMDFGHSATVWFKNVQVDVPPPPPPPAPRAGCTPGFWRQSQHYAFWAAPYAPTTAFGSVFADAFPGMTLGEVVQLNGGGLNALGRHTVAALLNAASPEVNYGMTPAEVIAAFNAAFASGSYDSQKDLFEEANERGCSVDKSASSTGGSRGKKK